MKIKVKDLEPNPFRKMKNYPIDRAKVEALKTSIKEKTFWDNILVRPNNDKFQIAYGHHRWIALKELKIKEIDVPVRDIDDATMVQIMAEENLNWSTSPTIMTQTIQIAKEFLDTKLQKYEDLAHAEHLFKVIFSSNSQFQQVKESGIGRSTLVKFLGGNWTLRKVQGALDIIKDDTLDKEAIRAIPTMEQARKFRESVKKHKIPKPTQKKIAKTIVKEGVGKRDIPDLVAEHSTLPKEKPEPKPLPFLDDFVKEICGLMNTLRPKLIHASKHLANIQSDRLRENFIRDGKELTEIMNEIFEVKNGKEEKNKKRILSNNC